MSVPFVFTRMTEDVNAELSVLRSHFANHVPDDVFRVFCIGSTGESAIALSMMDRVSSVLVCDLSEHQLRLARHLRDAFRALAHAEAGQFHTNLLELWGMAPHHDGQKAAELHAVVLDSMIERESSAGDKEFWAPWTKEMPRLAASGQSEKSFADLRSNFASCNIDLVSHPELVTSPDVSRIVFETFDITQNNNAEKFFAGKAMDDSQKQAAIRNLQSWFDTTQYPRVWASWLQAIEQRQKQAGVRDCAWEVPEFGIRVPWSDVSLPSGIHPVVRNPFWMLWFADPDSLASRSHFHQNMLPVVFCRSFCDFARSHLDRLERLKFEQGNATELLSEASKAHGLFHFITLSNIMDWMSPEQVVQCLDKIAPAVAPNGLVVLRKFFEFGSSTQSLESVVASSSHFCIHQEYTSIARSSERSAFAISILVLQKINPS